MKALNLVWMRGVEKDDPHVKSESAFDICVAAVGKRINHPVSTYSIGVLGFIGVSFA